MAQLTDITSFIERELNVAAITDYPGAMNGLQLACECEVPRIIAAVDASLPVIERAAAGGPGLLIVHHGMFWQGAQPLTGAFYRKIRAAMEAGLAIYSSHQPLDVHPRWGNNIRLAEAIGLGDPSPFLEHKGVPMGVRGTWTGTRQELTDRLAKVLGSPVHICPAGPENPRKIGIITGGAGSEVPRVAAAGIDTFITGEGPHWSYSLAEELVVNLFYGGHYATETFGVMALAQALSHHFSIPWSFIDHPTGL